VKACRLYNKGLACQKYILKLIEEYIPYLSLSSYVKRIPDQASKELYNTIPAKTASFLQMAMLTAFNKVAKRHIIKTCFKQNAGLEEKL